jgi:hypothetical protein
LGEALHHEPGSTFANDCAKRDVVHDRPVRAARRRTLSQEDQDTGQRHDLRRALLRGDGAERHQNFLFASTSFT